MARTLPEIQEIVRAAARRLTGADGATFVLRDGDKCFYADEDAISPLWKGQRFPLSACISGWAMLNREAVAIEDIYADDRIPHDAYRPTFVRSLAMVPIRTLAPIGAIGNYWAHPHAATQTELTLVQALADSTAVALENVRVVGELDARHRLLNTLAHEVRGPLGAAEAWLELLESGNATAEDMQHVRTAVGAAMRIVDEQLDAASLEAGKLRSRPEPVRLRAVFAELAGMFAASGAPGVELVVQEPADITLETDPRLLGQILRNLLSNAFKFTDAGEVRLSATVEGDAVAIVVADTGVGIALEQQESVFEEFVQVDGAQAGRRNGTGLGLPLVRRLAELLGGGVGLASAPGRGAVFTLTLPVDA